MSVLDIVGTLQNGANSTKGFNNASSAVDSGLSSAVDTLNAGRDAALGYLNPAIKTGNNAIDQESNVLGLNGNSWGSTTGITRADPYNIGAPALPTQATFNGPATPTQASFSFDPSTVNADSDPGLAYVKQQALGAVGQNAYATGKGLSGAATIQLAKTAGDIANQYFGQAYARDYGAASDAYTRDTNYNNTSYGQNYTAASDAYTRDNNFNLTNYGLGYGAATDAYGRANNQFTDYENQLSGAATRGQAAGVSASGVQTGISTTGANLQTSAANNIANLYLGKAAAQNSANSQLMSSITGTIKDAVMGYLGG